MKERDLTAIYGVDLGIWQEKQEKQVSNELQTKISDIVTSDFASRAYILIQKQWYISWHMPKEELEWKADECMKDSYYRIGLDDAYVRLLSTNKNNWTKTMLRIWINDSQSIYVWTEKVHLIQ